MATTRRTPITADIAFERVDIEEFRKHPGEYLAGREQIAVIDHGNLVGYYLPFRRDDQRLAESITELKRAISDVRNRTGLNEDELADLFDLKKPLAE